MNLFTGLVAFTNSDTYCTVNDMTLTTKCDLIKL